jgi:hypothetical protein
MTVIARAPLTNGEIGDDLRSALGAVASDRQGWSVAAAHAPIDGRGQAFRAEGLAVE